MASLMGEIQMINGPVILGKNMTGFKMREMVTVGEKKLIGEIIAIDGDQGTVQVYEETEGIKRGESIVSTGKPLSLKLGPGMLGNMFDGIQRPLKKIKEDHGSFIPEGIGLISIDEEQLWDAEIHVKVGDTVRAGQFFGKVEETPLITHRLLIPIGVEGEVIWAIENGSYNINEVLVKVKDKKGNVHDCLMHQEWPVRVQRP